MPIALLLAVAPAFAGGVASFTSEHSARGVTYNMMFAPPLANPQDGFGMAVADLDNDDDLDLVLLGRIDGLVGVYENNGVGVFTNRSTTSGIPATTAGCGVSAFDYDRDGDLDLFIAQKNQPSRMLRNNGGFQFTNVAAAAGVEESLPATGCSVVDFDGDGWLDLHLCTYSTAVRNRLYRNLGNGTFADVAPALGVDSAGLSYTSVWSDYDRDGWPDLCVSNDRGFATVPNQMWRNVAGEFTDVSAPTGIDVSLCSMGIACADLDGDARPDYYFTNVPDPTPPLNGVNPLLLGSASGAFTRAEGPWGVSHLKFSWAAIFWDFDNDADLDLYVNNESLPNTLYRNPGAPPMTDIASAAAVTGTANTSYVSMVGDLDRDGDLDLVVNNYGGAVRLYMNQEGQQRKWLRLRVAGEGRVRHAIGASATVQAVGPKGAQPAPQWREVLCGGNGYLAQGDMALHYGLGNAKGVQSVVVRWPAGGAVRTLTNVPINAAWAVYPPSRLGDVDGDGAVNLADWTPFAAWGLGPLAAGREMLDFDGDSDVDASDLSAFWSRASLRRGDMNGDGAVQADDLAALLSVWGSSGSTADFDLDGVVGAADLAALLSNWG
ncbi:MAG: FG-GAP-like repeat-containing protein [Planctomycetaceae bacterium]|nr:FG-GAP-like repeat-containing protein [Planctomycetaceae bacterium]